MLDIWNLFYYHENDSIAITNKHFLFSALRFTLLKPQAAVNIQHRAGDKACLLGCQKRDRGGNFFGFAGACQRS